jgi:hypothetical protein
MHIWTDLAAREAVYLVLLLALGAGPAALLPSRFDAGSRIAMAPALGFCLGTCLTTTLLQFWPTNDTYWVLIPLALASLALAAYRLTRSGKTLPWRERLPLRDIAALVLIGIVVTGPINYVLHERHTVGPAAYTYTDVDNYVALQDGAQTESLHTARINWHRLQAAGSTGRNLTLFTWDFFADQGSNLDATPLDSNVTSLLGLGASDTFSPFLCVLLLVGALGAFAAVRYWSRSRTWMATLSACLFGGALFLELWFDSYQAAIIAIGLLVPFVAICDGAIADPQGRRGTLGLIALIVGAFLSVYPLYLAMLAGAVGLMLIVRGFEARRSETPLQPLIRSAAIATGAVVTLSILFDLVGFTRDIRYYRLLAENKIGLPRVGWTLPLSVLPGWVSQTREFWNMPPLGHTDLKQLFLGGLLPLIFVGIVVVGLRRYRPALALLGLSAAAAVLAEYSYVSQQNCTYCAERDLLPFGPIVAVLVGLGLCALLASADRRVKLAGLTGLVLVVGSVGQRARVELKRFANASYFMDSVDRLLLSKLPTKTGPVFEEGFGASTYAQAEQTLVYHLLDERTGGRQTIVPGSNTGNAIQYLDFSRIELPPSPIFDPDYRYVFTRLSGVRTARRTLIRDGGVALQERVRPLDITPYGGLGTPLQRLDPSGDAWVQTEYPLQFLIAGHDGTGAVWARLTFRFVQPPTVPQQPGLRTRVSGHTLRACVRATGSEPYRYTHIAMSAPLLPGTPPAGEFPPAMPFEDVQLISMYAVSGRCSL